MSGQFSRTFANPTLRLAIICIALGGISTSSYGPYQSIIGIDRLGLTDEMYSVVAAIGAILSMIASISFGILTDQTGRRITILLLCMGLTILAGLLVYMAPSQWSFMLAHMLLMPAGASAFSQFYALARIAGKVDPHLDGAVAVSIVRAAFSATFAVTPPLWALAIANDVDVLNVYSVTAVSLMIAFFYVAVSAKQLPLAEMRERSGVRFTAGLRELGAPHVIKRMAILALIIGANALYNITLGLVIINNAGGTEADIGWYAGIVAGIEIPVMLGSGYLLRRLSTSGLIVIGCVIYAVFLAGLGLAPTMTVLWFLIVPAGTGAGILLSVTIAYVQDLVAERPGAGSSLVTVSFFSGLLVASGLFGIGTSIGDYQTVALLGLASVLTGGFGLFAVDGWQLWNRDGAQSDLR